MKKKPLGQVISGARSLIGSAVRRGLPRAGERLAEVAHMARQVQEVLRVQESLRVQTEELKAQQNPEARESQNSRFATPGVSPFAASKLAGDASPAPIARPQSSLEARNEPPVVARLIVELRSDGSHTIARGALQDELSGERVAIEAEGNSPLELAAKLAKSLLTAPLSVAGLRSSGLLNKKKID